MKFTIAIEAGTKKTAVGVVVPDLPGCFSAGDTVEEAFDNVRKAIMIHCEILAEEKKDIPLTKSMSEWQNAKEYKGWMWGIVDVEVDDNKSWARKMIATIRQNYAQAPHVAFYLPELEQVLAAPWRFLVDLDLAVADLMCR